jgi:hypothetical protein
MFRRSLLLAGVLLLGCGPFGGSADLAADLANAVDSANAADFANAPDLANCRHAGQPCIDNSQCNSWACSCSDGAVPPNAAHCTAIGQCDTGDNVCLSVCSGHGSVVNATDVGCPTP